MLAFRKGNFIDEKELSLEEAEVFVAFLEREIERHRIHMAEYKAIAQDDGTPDFARVVAQTVVIRNLDDIEHTKRTLAYLYDKFKEL